jgi:hypothetical protein
MDKRLGLKMLDLIENLYIENYALLAMLPSVYRTIDNAQVRSYMDQAKNDPQIRESVREQWLPMRQRLESDASLEEAMQQFLQIVPPENKVN